MQRPVNFLLVQSEVEVTTSRSSGPGGQNVNKVNSKVTLRFNVNESRILSDEEKSILRNKLSSTLTTDGTLLVSSQEKRSQLDNKESAVLKFDEILKRAFQKKKKRKATGPTKASKEKKLKSKKLKSEKKKLRQKFF